jgi:hypothetical protein
MRLAADSWSPVPKKSAPKELQALEVLFSSAGIAGVTLHHGCFAGIVRTKRTKSGLWAAFPSKRDDLYAYAAAYWRTSRHPAAVASALEAWVSSDVVLSKL